MNKLIQNISLKPYNTFGIDATADFWAEFSDSAQLVEIINECRERGLDWYILSGGSNIILTDTFKGVYIHPVGQRVEWNEGLLVSDAGVVWDDLVRQSVEDYELWGLQSLSYIPGLVGAAPVQNIGAYGSEVKDAIEWVEYLNTQTLEVERINGSNCQFGYRNSIFKGALRGRAIVVRVAFKLVSQRPDNVEIDYGQLRSEVEKRGRVNLKNIREAVIDIRRTKLPDPEIMGNAGSFFKNPVVESLVAQKIRAQYPDMPSFETSEGVKIPAGWLIDRAGWKGFRRGSVGVHSLQALVVVNHGGAKAEDILSLSNDICTDIMDKFGIQLTMEVNVL